MIRIEPPYLAVVLLTVVFLMLREKFELGSNATVMPSLPQVLLHIGYLIPFSYYSWLSIVFWTLAIEFQFYLIFSICFKLFVTKELLRWGIQSILLLLCFIFKSEEIFFHWAPVFLIGINLALFKKEIISKTELIICVSIIEGIIFYKLGLQIVIFSIVPFLLIHFESKVKIKLLDFFGKISYSLYLCHTLVAFAIINIGFRFALNVYNKIIFVSIACIATVFASYLLYTFFEKPFKKLASTIHYSR